VPSAPLALASRGQAVEVYRHHCRRRVVTAGGITATVAVASGFASHTESATAFALPALGSVVDQPSVVYASDGTTVLGTFQGPKTSVPVTLSRVRT